MTKKPVTPPGGDRVTPFVAHFCSFTIEGCTEIDQLVDGCSEEQRVQEHRLPTTRFHFMVAISAWTRPYTDRETRRHSVTQFVFEIAGES